MISCALLDVNDQATTSGIFTNMHQGVLEGVNVCVKRMRTYPDDSPDKLKVRI